MTTPNDRAGADTELERGGRRGIDGNLEGRVPETSGAVDDGECPPALDDRRDGVELVPIRAGQLDVPRDEAQAVTRVARELGLDQVPGDAARVPAASPRRLSGRVPPAASPRAQSRTSKPSRDVVSVAIRRAGAIRERP